PTAPPAAGDVVCLQRQSASDRRRLEETDRRRAHRRMQTGNKAPRFHRRFRAIGRWLLRVENAILQWRMRTAWTTRKEARWRQTSHSVVNSATRSGLRVFESLL